MGRPIFIRKQVVNGELLIGTWITMPSPAAVEIAGDAGYDFVTIDGEHSAFGRAQIEELVRAANAVDVPAIVRVPMHGLWIHTALDAGAGGIMIPHVDTAEQARMIVSEARYPPEGHRGVGAGRASRYGMDILPYLENANDSVLVVLMIESVEGVRNIDEIVSVPGVDAVFIGMGDLGLSIKHTPDAGFDMDEAMSIVVKAAAKAGVTSGVMAVDLDTYGKWKNAGMTFMMVGVDTMVLGSAWQDLAHQARAR